MWESEIEKKTEKKRDSTTCRQKSRKHCGLSGDEKGNGVWQNRKKTEAVARSQEDMDKRVTYLEKGKGNQSGEARGNNREKELDDVMKNSKEDKTMVGQTLKERKKANDLWKISSLGKRYKAAGTLMEKKWES